MIKEYIENGKTQFFVEIRGRSDDQVHRITRRRKGIDSRELAEQAEAELDAEVSAEIARRVAIGQTWKHLVLEWADGVRTKHVFATEMAESTLLDYLALLNKFTQAWGAEPIDKIKKATVWQTLESCRRLNSVKTVKKLRKAIEYVFHWAIVAERVKGIDKPPTDGYKVMAKRDEKIPEILNLVQLQTLLSEARDEDHPWYPIWNTALITGMRSGELFALRWPDVDLESRIIYVHKNWTSRDGYGPTKGRYWRAIPVDDDNAMSFLKEMKVAGGHSGKVWQWVNRASEDPKDRKIYLHYDDFVLPRFDDWRAGQQAKILRAYCVEIGIPSVQFHALRACFATQLLINGISTPTIMKICGWKDLETMQRYIRLAGIDVRGATKDLRLPTHRKSVGEVVELFGSRRL